MNAITPVAAGASMALLPQNLTEAMKLAELMSKAKLLPVAVQNHADAFMIVNQALRWGMDPFAVAQEVAVIQGKMMYSGKIVAAALHTSGVLDGRLSYEYAGENGAMSVTATGLLRGEKEPRSVTVALKDAKTANQHWAKSPQQMLGYHAARVWARRHAPEVMLGVYAPEEFEPEPRPEPRHVQSVQSPRPAAKLDPVAAMKRAELDRVLDNDDIPSFDAPKPEPKPVVDQRAVGPDRARLVADRFRERMATVARLLDSDGPDRANDEYNAIMANSGLQAEWAKIRDSRPELDSEMQDAASEGLNAIIEARALTDVPA